MSKEKLLPIVIATFNGLDYTKECIKAVREYTKVPYRLIVVDNDSKDGTKDYLRSLTDIDLIENEKNLGFAGGYNVGLKHALDTYDFDYLLLLNNDVLVSPSYVERLMEPMAKDDKCMLVGCMSNYAGGIQGVGVPSTMKTFEDIARFADERYKSHGKNIVRAGMVVGLLYLVRKQTLTEIGLFDDRFFPGQWEDNDYCVRILEKGYRLYVHGGVFVYHYGGKSLAQFNQGNIFFENKKRFFEKYSKTHKENPKLVGMLRVKNGEKWVGRCLEAASKMCDEIVILDDHSTDNTYDICATFPKVTKLETSKFDTFDEGRDRELIFTWAKEKGADWIWCMDHDEIPEESLINNVKRLMKPTNPQTLGYIFRICTFWNSEQKVRTDGLWGPFYQCRLFKILPNQYIKSEGDDNLHCGSHPFIPQECLTYTHYRIKHYGYVDKEGRQKKFEWYESIDKEKDLGQILGGWREFYHNLYYGRKS